MTYLMLERFAVAPGTREQRAFDFDRERSIDALAGRTVWSASGVRASRPDARRLAEALGRPGAERAGADRLEVAPGEPPPWLAEPGEAGSEAYDEAMRDGEAIVGGHVRPDDIVVFHDPVTALLAPVVREWGAHAVWDVGTPAAAPEEGEPWTWLQPSGQGIDAYVRRSQRPVAETLVVERIAALVPASGVVTAKDVEERPAEPHPEVGWRSMLADVVTGDRRESVGGTLHPRPSVAVR